MSSTGMNDTEMNDTATTQTPDSAGTTTGGTGIRVATAVIGGSIALLTIAAAAISQFGIAGAASSTTTEAIPASVTSIDITNTIGDVSVFTTPGASPSVEIRTDSFAFNRSAQATVEIDGSELSINVPDRKGPCFLGCWSSVTILIELGDVALDELEIGSDVGTIAVHEGVVVRDLSVESAVGDVRLDLVDAMHIDAASDVGTIQIWAAEPTRSITATSAVGDIEIGVQPGIDFDVRATSEVGSVDNEFVSTTSTTHTITASSDVGSVTIYAIR